MDQQRNNKCYTVYSKKGCPFCSLMKLELNAMSIPFEEIDLSDDSIRAEFYKKYGVSTVPQLFISACNSDGGRLSHKRLGDYSEMVSAWDSLII